MAHNQSRRAQPSATVRATISFSADRYAELEEIAKQ